MRLLKTLLYLTSIIYNLFPVQSLAQCANFEIKVNKLDACAPEVIKYYVTNAPAGSLFEWDIAGNTFFGGDTVYQTHANPLTLTPKVKITLPDNTICSVVGNNSVTIHGSPEPIFTALPTILCDGPGKSQLTDITPNTQARNWIVDGDNYSNTATTIEHEFFTLGKKTVSLIVTDIFGCKGVKTFEDTIEVLPNLEFDFDAAGLL